MSSSGDSPYRVIVSRRLAKHVELLHDIALRAGIGTEFIDALQRIQDGLQRDPFGFGEALYRLPVLKLLVCVQAAYPLAVDYAVHEEQPLVFVRKIRLIWP